MDTDEHIAIEIQAARETAQSQQRRPYAKPRVTELSTVETEFHGGFTPDGYYGS